MNKLAFFSLILASVDGTYYSTALYELTVEEEDSVVIHFEMNDVNDFFFGGSTLSHEFSLEHVSPFPSNPNSL